MENTVTLQYYVFVQSLSNEKKFLFSDSANQ